MEFSKIIRKRMIDLDLTLSDIPGASKSSWSKWIRDPYSARLDHLVFLMTFLGIEESEKSQIIENLIRSAHEKNQFRYLGRRFRNSEGKCRKTAV